MKYLFKKQYVIVGTMVERCYYFRLTVQFWKYGDLHRVNGDLYYSIAEAKQALKHILTKHYVNIEEL